MNAAAMSTVLPLHQTVAMVTARYLLDHNDRHSQECRIRAQTIIQQLRSNLYTAVSKDILDQFLTSYPKELTGELMYALVPPHLKSLSLIKCQKLLDEELVKEYQYLNAVLERCSRLQSLSLDDCDLHSSQDLCKSITQYASGLSSISLENCSGVNDEMVQMLIQGLPKLRHLNLSMIRKITDRVFALHSKQDDDNNLSRPGSNLTSVDLAGCQQLSSSCIRHLTELCGPNLQSLNVANTGMDCTILWYLSGYSLSTAGQLAVLANKNLMGEETTQGVQLAELLKDLQNLQQKLKEKVDEIDDIIQKEETENTEKEDGKEKGGDQQDGQVCNKTTSNQETDGRDLSKDVQEGPEEAQDDLNIGLDHLAPTAEVEKSEICSLTTNMSKSAFGDIKDPSGIHVQEGPNQLPEGTQQQQHPQGALNIGLENLPSTSEVDKTEISSLTKDLSKLASGDSRHPLSKDVQQESSQLAETLQEQTQDDLNIGSEHLSPTVKVDKTEIGSLTTDMSKSTSEGVRDPSTNHVQQESSQLPEGTQQEPQDSLNIELDHLFPTADVDTPEISTLTTNMSKSSSGDGMNDYYSSHQSLASNLNDRSSNLGTRSAWCKQNDTDKPVICKPSSLSPDKENCVDHHLQRDSSKSDTLPETYTSVEDFVRYVLDKSVKALQKEETAVGDASGQMEPPSDLCVVDLEDISFDALQCDSRELTDTEKGEELGSIDNDKSNLASLDTSDDKPSKDDSRTNLPKAESAIIGSAIGKSVSERDRPIHVPSSETANVQQSSCTAVAENKDQINSPLCLQRLYKPKITSLDIGHIKFDEILARTCLHEFFQANKGLKKLTVSWNELQDSLLEIIASASNELQHLALFDCESITSPGLAHLLTHCPKLQQLDLQGACFISDFGLMPLFLKGERGAITSLRLSETNVTNVSLSHIAKYLGTKLTSLELSWCEEITEVGLTDITTKCVSLETFHARQGKLCGNSLVTLSENCTGLTCLNLSSVDCLTDSVVIEMVSHLHQMKELDISWNSALTDSSISAVMCNCPLVTELYAAGLKRTTEKPLLPIVANFDRWRRCLALIRIKMRERRILREAGDPHLSSDEEYEDLYVPIRSTSYAPNLTYLDVQYCDRMKDKILAQIVAICRGTLTIKDYYGEDIIPKLLHSVSQ